jgi:hypothetical protein
MTDTDGDLFARLSDGQRTALDRRFDHHPPADRAAAQRHERWRAAVKQLAATALAELPPGRETSLVLTRLDDVLWCGNAALARPAMRGVRPPA